MKTARFYIRIQARGRGRGKKFAAWPITFPSWQAAHYFMQKNFTFKNMPWQPLSASVERCRERKES